MVDFKLSADQVSLQRAAREFAQSVIRPSCSADTDREWVEDSEKRYPWEVIEKGADMKLKDLGVPTEYGGLGITSPLTLCIILEEFAVADGGIANTFNHLWKDMKVINALGTQKQKEEILTKFVNDKRFITTSAGTEPAHGSDWTLPYEGTRFDTTARLDGDQWVINGSKVCISNGSTASLYFVYATTDPAKPFTEGTSVLLVPKDAPGLTRGRDIEKTGLRFLNNATITFDNCRIPKDNLLGEPNTGMRAVREYLKDSNLFSATIVLGVARNAYEVALEHASQRLQGGTRIINHQAVGMMLAEMLAYLEATRNMIWKAAWSAEHVTPYDPKLGPMIKWFAVEASLKVCLKAVEIFGFAGALRDVQVNKCLRDVLMYLSSDGTQQINLLKIQRILAAATVHD